MKINHIFFDLDHTLWDFETNSDIAFQTIFKQHNVKVSLEKFLNYYKPINKKYWNLYSKDKVSKEDLRVGRLKDTFNKINVQVSDELIDKLSIDYIKVLPDSNLLFDGAHDLLTYLQPNYEMHIITNGFNEVQFKKLEKSNLTQYFKSIITSEDVGVKKPNPIIFKHALTQANATANESIMIGDNWEADIMGAKNSGFDVIYCNFNNEPVSESIKSVTNLTQIKKYL